MRHFIPQELLRPHVLALKVADSMQLPADGPYQAHGVLGHRGAMHVAGVRHHHIAGHHFRQQQRMHGRRGRVNPFQAAGRLELLGSHRKRNHQIRVHDLGLEAAVAIELHHVELREIMPNAIGKRFRRYPEMKMMMHRDDKFHLHDPCS